MINIYGNLPGQSTTILVLRDERQMCYRKGSDRAGWLAARHAQDGQVIDDSSKP
jgi:hypothetical protein